MLVEAVVGVGRVAMWCRDENSSYTAKWVRLVIARLVWAAKRRFSGLEMGLLGAGRSITVAVRMVASFGAWRFGAPAREFAVGERRAAPSQGNNYTSDLVFIRFERISLVPGCNGG